MAKTVKSLAMQLLHTESEDLTERERRVLERLIERRKISKNMNTVFDRETTRGQKVADAVARFGGSWTFIILFFFALVLWTGSNALIALSGNNAFDAYPFIFLNLILSMLAAIQAPIIMMSQNRQSEKDRISAGHDYEVNLKAELEIMQLHNKMDEMRQSEITALIEKQAHQITLMEKLLDGKKA
jgi:uncharacterized membrane protein